MHFTRYLALGDSISIDLYPALDYAGASDWVDSARLRRGLGAASLFHRNDDVVWPEFRGRDLASRYPGLTFRNGHDLGGPTDGDSDNLTSDGATTDDVRAYQLPRVTPSDEPTLVTLTVGGNDMLAVLHRDPPPRNLVAGMASRLRRILRDIKARRPQSLVLVTNVYDPSDGTNQLGDGRRLDEPARWLADYNLQLRVAVAETEGARLADIHRHFLGHGLTAPPDERWYWRGLIVEPGARGASEVRRVWLACLEEARVA
jgi:lysophospholipase L1-like esterase